MENTVEFYPTPKGLLREITKKIHFWELDAVLEPYDSRRKSKLLMSLMEEKSSI